MWRPDGGHATGRVRVRFLCPPYHSALCRLPAAAAAVAGNDAAPAAGTILAGEAAITAGVREADLDRDRYPAVAADAAGHLAAACRRDAAAIYRERKTVRAAISGSGGEHHVPGAVIGSIARPHASGFGGAGRGNRNEERGGQHAAQGA